MSTHDLLSEDDFFSEINKDKKPEPEAPKESLPEDDLFEGMPLKDEEQAEVDEPELPEPEPQPEAELPQDFSEDVKDEFELDQPAEPLIESEPLPEAEPETQREAIAEDYYESKQEKISYKPIIIGAAAVAVIIAAFFIVKIFVLDSKEAAPAAEQQPETQPAAEETGPSSEELRKAAFFKSLTAETKESLGSVSSVAALASAGNKVSSVHLYGDETMVEVFCKDRSALAKLNMEIKQNNPGLKTEIISSRVRPGEAGGIVGLFKITKSNAGSSRGGEDVGTPFNSTDDAKSWLGFLTQNNSLSLKNSKTRNLGREEDFTVIELEANISGRVSNCLNLINDVASSSKNLKVHKLNLTAEDQKNFSPNKYQLRMILKIFV